MTARKDGHPVSIGIGECRMTIGKRSGQDKQPERPKRTQGCASTLTERSATIKKHRGTEQDICHLPPITNTD